ncbi:MAG: ribosome assembly cofactor RimP [Flavobacteriaceae bacterium]|nr:ribosome assembly cofactor RimP [Flavobacteriaceae bacterium]
MEDLANHIKQIVDKILKAETDLYLVDLHTTNDGRVKLVLDSDGTLTLRDCERIHRRLVTELQRSQDIYSVEVTSAGLGSPLKLKRQYYKRIGSKLSVLTDEGKTFQGELTNANEENIELQWKTRERKDIGKGKHTVINRQSINYNQISKAKELI